MTAITFWRVLRQPIEGSAEHHLLHWLIDGVPLATGSGLPAHNNVGCLAPTTTPKSHFLPEVSFTKMDAGATKGTRAVVLLSTRFQLHSLSKI